MAVNLVNISKKLVKALNANGVATTMTIKDIMLRDGRVAKFYSINKAVWNTERERYENKELYSSPSMIRIVFYLRDMWHIHNGWELPMDQEQWNLIRPEELRKHGKHGT